MGMKNCQVPHSWYFGQDWGSLDSHFGVPMGRISGVQEMGSEWGRGDGDVRLTLDNLSQRRKKFTLHGLKSRLVLYLPNLKAGRFVFVLNENGEETQLDLVCGFMKLGTLLARWL